MMVIVPSMPKKSPKLQTGNDSNVNVSVIDRIGRHRMLTRPQSTQNANHSMARNVGN
jgi:hypothetical protein